MDAQVRVPAEWDSEVAILFRAVLENVTGQIVGVVVGGVETIDLNKPRFKRRPGEECWQRFLQSCCGICGTEIVIKTWQQFWGPDGVPVDDLHLAAKHLDFIEKQRPRNVL